jgi:CheY-like chemotaxis protein
MIEADPAMMTQLLVNLCMNAIHAMEHKESGVLSVHLGNSEPDATVLQRTGMTPGEYVLLQVADTGTGIDESVLPHIFKPFFTTKSPGKGTGLGLHMVQRVVREIHGGIDLTTASGTGTRFDIYIPRLETRARADQHAKDAPVHGHGNLLVVDDQPEVARLLQKILTRLDYSAHLETTSVQALAWMESQQQPIDLCIIDLSMPELNGLQLIESIRKRFPDMPVIIISGSHPPEESDEGFNRIKPWKFIAKPIDISEMADCLHSLLASAPRQP